LGQHLLAVIIEFDVSDMIEAEKLRTEQAATSA
jgi:hypothetical protein